MTIKNNAKRIDAIVAGRMLDNAIAGAKPVCNSCGRANKNGRECEAAAACKARRKAL